MPRIRTLKPEAFQHRKVGKLSDRAFRLWVAMICHADDEGRLVADPDQLRVLVWGYHPSVKSIAEPLAELESSGLLRLYHGSDGIPYADFPSWSDHQRIDHASKSKLPEYPGSGTGHPDEDQGYRKTRIPDAVRREVAVRYGAQEGVPRDAACHYCQAGGQIVMFSSVGWVALKDLEYDHLIPESAGGQTVAENVVLACRSCNRSKGTKNPREFSRILAKTPEGSRIGRDQGREGNGGERALLREDSRALSTNGRPVFRIPSPIAAALTRAPRLGATPRLGTPAFWQAEVRANPGVDFAGEVLKAEAYLSAHPEKHYRHLETFLHNWLGRADREPLEA